MSDPRLLVETGDRNVYNLSQLPMFQAYNPSRSSTYRYTHMLTTFTQILSKHLKLHNH